MKLRVERDVLADAVAWVARSLPARPPVPVLAGLMLRAEERTLTLSGFDYEVSTRVEIDAEVGDPGRALVSGRLLADISRSLPDRPVELAAMAGRVNLNCGSSRFTLLTLPVEDYPTLPEMPTASGSVSGLAFAGAVGSVAVAASRDDSIAVLTGVRLEIDGERLTLAATDRYRLAVRELPWSPEQTGLSTTALVPARNLADTARALAGADKVTLALAGTGAAEALMGFEGGGRRTTTRLLDGEFPKYRPLLPTESSSVATVATDALVESVKRVALVAERHTPVRLSFTDGALTLEAGTGDEAQASETLDAHLDGDDLQIAFNPAYLLDGLNALDTLGGVHTELSFTTSSRPAVLRAKHEPQAEAAEDYRYLLMPVRLSA